MKAPLLLLALAFCAPLVAQAAETPISIRVISEGAKFIGSSMGGIAIKIEDVSTGEVLAKGTTTGSTGDTKIIMKDSHRRDGVRSSEGSARFDEMIDIDVPTHIRVTAHGPLAQMQSANTVTATRWVLPEVGISGGDGWLIEMPGLVLDVLSPPVHTKMKGLPQTVDITANVTMMCGCPLTPGGHWDAKDFIVRALVTRDGAPFREINLNYAGKPSQFATELKVADPGLYDVIVTAHTSKNGNAGIDRTTFIVAE